MSRKVTIKRDSWSVPYIYADSAPGAWFGVGYAQAQDQLPGILRTYLRMHADLARVFGGIGVNVDFGTLRWKHLEHARIAFERSSPELRTVLEAFVDGIRTYMDDHPDEVPEWAPELEPALPIATLRAGLWTYAILDGFGAAVQHGITIDPDAAAEYSVHPPPREHPTSG